jgi:acetyl-CoA carboxylase beta subunit
MNETWVAALAKIFYLTVVAIAGILMRHAHAAATNGQFQLKIFLIACLTAPALGMIAGGISAYFGVEGPLLWAIVALTGFLGPAFIHAVALVVSGKLLKKLPE